jgi:MFS family permease
MHNNHKQSPALRCLWRRNRPPFAGANFLMSPARRIACVLLPFAAGYYLSYLFRSINALIAGDLTAELGLSAADLGLLTSVYFLLFAAAQLPFGVLLDSHGPRTIQSALLLVAAAGALVFALADGLIGLIVGRALIGLGVALALMSGFKAIVLWFPVERVAMANGWLVMLGALGAATATGPADLAVSAFGWRGLFALLAALSAMAALLVLFAVPDTSAKHTPSIARRPVSLSSIYRDPRFWRLAPLSTLGIGTSWSLQGLWAAPWLRDVAGLERAAVVHHLGTMAIALSVSAVLLGAAADRLRRARVRTEIVLASTLSLSMAAQLALIVEAPLPSYLFWVVIAAAGAATVLSYASIASYFPSEASGRANGALNLLHMGGTFLLQSATGFIIEQWPHSDGRYPIEAHQAALAIGFALQLAALLWFAAPKRRPVLSMQHAVARIVRVEPWRITESWPHAISISLRRTQIVPAEQRITSSRYAAAASAFACIPLVAALVTQTTHGDAPPHALGPGHPRMTARTRPRAAASGACDAQSRLKTL